MSINLFYNIRLVQRDRFSLTDDILSGLRKSYFDSFDKIRDRITIDSEADAVSYDYALEQGRPMKWIVKDKRGTTLEETKPGEGQKYLISVYKDGGLFKRIVFSKMHTLLKVEYYDTVKGELVSSIEPRRAPSGLCILLKSLNLKEPLILYAAPPVDQRAADIVDREFTEFYVEASTNEGIVRYMTDKQRESYLSLVEKALEEIAASSAVPYLSREETPLAEKLNVKDFNIKRNLAASLDITQAQEFISEYEEMDDEVTNLLPKEQAEPPYEEPAPVTAPENGSKEQSLITEPEQTSSDEEEETVDIEQQSDLLAQKIMGALSAAEVREVVDEREPDKVIESEDTSFYYFGELDANGNRSGYGRTVTAAGRTAYEGCYLDDKRSGTGSYYYKDGSLCYAGDWDENRRHGVGVGVSSIDGSIHVGTWVDNRPKGNGARFSEDGNIKFVCKQTEDKETCLLNFMPDDSVIIALYDKDGKKIGEKTIPIKNLLD